MLKTEPLLLTGGNVEISAAGKTPTVTLLADSGGLMSVPVWGPVVIDLAGLAATGGLTERPLDQRSGPLDELPILADHDATREGVALHGHAEIHNHRLMVADQISAALCLCTTNVELAFFPRDFVLHVHLNQPERASVRFPNVETVGERPAANRLSVSLRPRAAPG